MIEDRMPLTVHFRYLKEEGLNNLFGYINNFCTLDFYIEDFRLGTINLIKSAYTSSHNKSSLDMQNNITYQRQLIKLLEIAYTLKCNNTDLEISEKHPFYRKGSYWFGYHIDNNEPLSYPAIYFRQLNDSEINNVSLFFDDLFSFMSLSKWHETMDNLILCACSTENYDDTYADNGCPMVFVMEYLEKLVESIFLINHIRTCPL